MDGSNNKLNTLLTKSMDSTEREKIILLRVIVKTLLSFVIPCYRSEKTIRKVIEEIITTVAQRPEYDYEIITINDSSPDNVYEELKKLAAENSKIKVIDFAKNMGKHAAVMAGYSVCQGDYVVNLDDDYQCPVYELWKLLELVERDECDYATAKYIEKKQSAFKNFGSNINLLMITFLLNKPKSLRFENFSVMKRLICQEIIKYKHPYPYLEGLILRVTHRIETVEMEERNRGDDNQTGFTFKKSVSLLLNGLTAFSVKPLRIASVLGIIFSFLGFSGALYAIVTKLFNPEVPAGYSSLIASILLTNGLIMAMLGLIGEYIGRVYICLNASPQYVIKNTINLEQTSQISERYDCNENH